MAIKCRSLKIFPPVSKYSLIRGMLKCRIFIFAFGFFSVCATALEIPTQTLKRPDGSVIDFYLLNKSDESPSDTLLLILQGSDCNSVLKVESIFSDFRYVWPAADLLLVEKYGITRELEYSSDSERPDCPQTYLRNDSPKQRVSDAKAVLKAVLSDFAYPRLIVLGGSEGAPVANLLAAELNTIDATVAFNGGGRMFIDDVLHSIRTGAASSEEAAKAAQGFLGFSNHVLSSEPSDLEVSGHGYRWWHQMLSIDQLNVLKAVNTPLLVIQGGLDTSVSPEKVNEMIESLRKAQKNNIDFIPYGNLDHTFNDEQEVSHQDEVVEDIRQWLKSKLI